MMTLGLPIDMDLGFFINNGVAVTSAPLDIRLICFTRPSTHNTLHEIWNFSNLKGKTTNQGALELVALICHDNICE
jgi:hypothetical protein